MHKLSIIPAQDATCANTLRGLSMLRPTATLHTTLIGGQNEALLKGHCQAKKCSMFTNDDVKGKKSYKRSSRRASSAMQNLLRV